MVENPAYDGTSDSGPTAMVSSFPTSKEAPKWYEEFQHKDKSKLTEPGEEMSEDYMLEDIENFDLFLPNTQIKAERHQEEAKLKAEKKKFKPTPQMGSYVNTPVQEPPILERCIETTGDRLADDEEGSISESDKQHIHVSTELLDNKSALQGAAGLFQTYNPDENFTRNKNILLAIDKKQQKRRKQNQAHTKSGATSLLPSDSQSNRGSESMHAQGDIVYPLRQVFKEMDEMAEQDAEKLVPKKRTKEQSIEDHKQKQRDAVSVTVDVPLGENKAYIPQLPIVAEPLLKTNTDNQDREIKQGNSIIATDMSLATSSESESETEVNVYEPAAETMLTEIDEVDGFDVSERKYVTLPGPLTPPSPLTEDCKVSSMSITGADCEMKPGDMTTDSEVSLATDSEATSENHGPEVTLLTEIDEVDGDDPSEQKLIGPHGLPASPQPLTPLTSFTPTSPAALSTSLLPLNKDCGISELSNGTAHVFFETLNPDETLVRNKNIMLAIDREQRNRRKQNQGRSKSGAASLIPSHSQSNSETKQGNIAYPLRELFKSIGEMSENDVEQLVRKPGTSKQTGHLQNPKEKQTDVVSGKVEVLLGKNEDGTPQLPVAAEALPKSHTENQGCEVKQRDVTTDSNSKGSLATGSDSKPKDIAVHEPQATTKTGTAQRKQKDCKVSELSKRSAGVSKTLNNPDVTLTRSKNILLAIDREQQKRRKQSQGPRKSGAASLLTSVSSSNSGTKQQEEIAYPLRELFKSIGEMSENDVEQLVRKPGTISKQTGHLQNPKEKQTVVVSGKIEVLLGKNEDDTPQLPIAAEALPKSHTENQGCEVKQRDVTTDSNSKGSLATGSDSKPKDMSVHEPQATTKTGTAQRKQKDCKVSELSKRRAGVSGTLNNPDVTLTRSKNKLLAIDREQQKRRKQSQGPRKSGAASLLTSVSPSNSGTKQQEEIAYPLRKLFKSIGEMSENDVEQLVRKPGTISKQTGHLQNPKEKQTDVVSGKVEVLRGKNEDDTPQLPVAAEALPKSHTENQGCEVKQRDVTTDSNSKGSLATGSDSKPKDIAVHEPQATTKTGTAQRKQKDCKVSELSKRRAGVSKTLNNPDVTLTRSKNILLAIDREQQKKRKQSQGPRKSGAASLLTSVSPSNSGTKQQEEIAYPLRELFKSIGEMSENDVEQLVRKPGTSQQTDQVHTRKQSHAGSVQVEEQPENGRKQNQVNSELGAASLPSDSQTNSESKQEDIVYPLQQVFKSISEMTEKDTKATSKKSTKEQTGQDHKNKQRDAVSVKVKVLLKDNVPPHLPETTDSAITHTENLIKQGDIDTKVFLAKSKVHVHEPVTTTKRDKVDGNVTSEQISFAQPGPPGPPPPPQPPASYIDSDKPSEQAIGLDQVNHDKQRLVPSETDSKEAKSDCEVFDKRTKEVYREVYECLLQESESITDKCHKFCSKSFCITYTCTPCALVEKKGDKVERLKNTTDALQTANTKGWNIFVYLVTPLLYSLIRDGILLLELIIGFVELVLSATSFGLGSNAGYNVSHLVVSAVALLLAIIDLLTSCRSYGACRLLWFRYRFWRSNREIRRQINDTECATTNQENINGLTSSERNNRKDIIPLVLRKFGDILRNLTTEGLLYILLICDLIELIVGKSYQRKTALDTVNLALFIISLAFLILYVYFLRLLVLVLVIVDLYKKRKPLTTKQKIAALKAKQEKERKEQLESASLPSKPVQHEPTNDKESDKMNSIIATKGVVFEVLFLFHLFGQMTMQFLMIVAIGLKIAQDNRGKTLDDPLHISGALWFMLVAGYVMPYAGIMSFFIATYYWAYEYPIGICINLLSIFDGPGIDVALFPEKTIRQLKMLSEKMAELLNKTVLKQDFKQLTERTWCTKFCFPFRSPPLILFCTLYGAMQFAFVLVTVISIQEENFGVIVIIYYFFTVILGLIANAYVFTVGALWVAMVTGVLLLVVLIIIGFVLFFVLIILVIVCWICSLSQTKRRNY